MEQKRTLWIIAAVGVFLLVVIGAALILYSPQVQTKPAIASIEPTGQSFSDGWVTQPADDVDTTLQPISKPEGASVSGTTEAGDQIDGTMEAPNPLDSTDPSVSPDAPQAAQQSAAVHTSDAMTVITGTTNVYGVTTNNTTGNSQTADGTTTTIDLNTLKAVSNTHKQLSTASTGTTAAPAPKPAAPENKVKPKEKKQITRKPAKKPAVKAAAAPKKLAPAYWVQAASFTVKHSADNARDILDGNRIPSEIFTYKDAKGRLYYRVRVGPYTTKSEAEYWQNRIIQINEFSKTSSYITNSSAPLK